MPQHVIFSSNISSLSFFLGIQKQFWPLLFFISLSRIKIQSFRTFWIFKIKIESLKVYHHLPYLSTTYWFSSSSSLEIFFKYILKSTFLRWIWFQNMWKSLVTEFPSEVFSKITTTLSTFSLSISIPWSWSLSRISTTASKL